MGKSDRKKRKKNKKTNKNKEVFNSKNSPKTVIKDFKELRRLKGESEMNDYYETINERLEHKENNPIHFLKWSAKYNELDGSKIKEMADFSSVFPFANPNDKNDKKFKNTEFALAWFKQRIKNNGSKIYSMDKTRAKNSSGIINENSLQTEVDKLIPFSFFFHVKIKLTAPYFSRDDDDFYLIDNPILKEKVFKVPMIRGSSWKGAIASAFKDLINEETDLKKENKIIQAYIRIFGTGSNEFRELLENIKKKLKNEGELDMQKVIKFFLFELGLKLTKKDIDSLKDKSEIDSWVEEKLVINLHDSSKDLPSYLTIHKGRAIFYPTYFDKLSLEIINPHSRKTRAGTNPIHYEVVPKDTSGILQIVYIPFDGVLTDENELKKQVGKDIEFLTKCIKKVSKNGVGAKTKLGWGQFEIVSLKYCINEKIEGLSIPDWKKCEVEDGE